MKRTILAAAFAGLLATSALAQTPPGRPPGIQDITFSPIAAPAQPDAIALYPGVAPGSEGSRAVEIWDMASNGKRVVRNVTRPTLTPVLPDPAKATGAAVIVAPGGGFKMLAMDDEGWPVARWLADHGVAAFVLKYRVNETPADEATFVGTMGKVFAAAAASGATPALAEPRATADALQALRMVRARAREWNVDPSRIGMIGFSAGAMTTLNAALAPSPADRPSFVGFIYGPMTALDAPAGAPPMFAALAMDDPLFGRQGFGIVDSWKKVSSPIELHVYEAGGHGFGLGRPGTTTALMPEEFLAWMRGRGLLGAHGPSPSVGPDGRGAP